MTELGNTLWQLLVNLGSLLLLLGELVLRNSLLIAWLAWWLWGVNWNKVWPVLKQGGWVIVVLITVTAALVWSQMLPSDCNSLGFVTVPNFWWQLGGVGLVTAVTLFCGWLQGVFGWAPAEVELEPPAPAAHELEHEHH